MCSRIITEWAGRRLRNSAVHHWTIFDCQPIECSTNINFICCKHDLEYSIYFIIALIFLVEVPLFFFFSWSNIQDQPRNHSSPWKHKLRTYWQYLPLQCLSVSSLIANPWIPLTYWILSFCRGSWGRGSATSWSLELSSSPSSSSSLLFRQENETGQCGKNSTPQQPMSQLSDSHCFSGGITAGVCFSLKLCHTL